MCVIPETVLVLVADVYALGIPVGTLRLGQGPTNVVNDALTKGRLKDRAHRPGVLSVNIRRDALDHILAGELSPFTG